MHRGESQVPIGAGTLHNCKLNLFLKVASIVAHGIFSRHFFAGVVATLPLMSAIGNFVLTTTLMSSSLVTTNALSSDICYEEKPQVAVMFELVHTS